MNIWPNKANQHGSLKALRQKRATTFNTQLFATLAVKEITENIFPRI